MRFKKYLPLFVICLSSVAFVSWTIDKMESTIETVSPEPQLKSVRNTVSNFEIIFDSLQLEDKGLSHEAFEHAIDGFEKLEEEGALKNDSILTIIDFDQPSYKKRLYVLDIKHYKMLFNTWVAHGKNTGKELAEYFSNKDESNKSSLGFYVTEETYNGSNGYSLKLKGLERGTNSNALRRAIVMHGADYVSQSFINAQGYIGRSHGCPAVPVALNRPIIQTIKNGSCLFIYNRSYKPCANFVAG